jgi:hypothetical protein
MMQFFAYMLIYLVTYVLPTVSILSIVALRRCTPYNEVIQVNELQMLSLLSRVLCLG